MPRRPTLFLAYDYADYPLDAEGLPTLTGVSSRSIGEWVKEQIRVLSGDAVDVVSVQDPISESISTECKRAIDAADVVVCLFTKRTQCPVHGHWTTSQYVISESGFADKRYREDAKKRLFGFVEEGVDRTRLGLAFPSDRTAPPFRRDNLPKLIPYLKEIIGVVLDPNCRRTGPEHLLLQKTVRVHMDGRVEADVLHRFRIREVLSQFQMQHTLWRVSHELPNVTTMLKRLSGRPPYLRFVIGKCGDADVRHLRCDLKNIHAANHKRDYKFTLEIPGVSLIPGDIVEYQFAWAYPDAFLPAHVSAPEKPNSCGLRAGSCGLVDQVDLYVMFERNWNGHDWLPCIEDQSQQSPAVWHCSETMFPAMDDPEHFWHHGGPWHNIGGMHSCPEKETAVYEAYHCSMRGFSGFLKATWTPVMNYHRAPSEEEEWSDRDSPPTIPDDSRRHGPR